MSAFVSAAGASQVTLTNSAAEFIQNQISKEVSLALGGEKVFHAALDQFVDPSQPLDDHFYTKVDDQMKVFQKTLESFEKLMLQNKNVSWSHQPGEPFTLNDVLKAATDAKLKHQECKDTWDKIREGFRKLSRHSQAIKPWLKCLPQDVYGSAIAGSFAVVLATASRLDIVRTEIYEHLAMIPGKLERIRQYTRSYASPDLHRCSADVYVAVFVALELIMQELLANPTKKVIKSVFHGSTYGHKIDEGLNAISHCVDAFNGQADLCANHRLGDVHVNTVTLIAASEKTETQVEGVKEGVESIQECLGQLQYQGDELKRFLREWKEDSQSQRAAKEQLAIIEQKIIALEQENEDYRRRFLRRQSTLVVQRIYEQLSSSQIYDGAYGDLNHQALALHQFNNRFLTRPKLPRKWTEALRKSRYLFNQDARTCLAVLPDLSGLDKDRIFWIIESEKVRDWLRCSTSQVIMLRGETGSIVPLGPIPYATALVASALKKYNVAKYPVLGYFCSLHTDADYDLAAGGIGMLRALTGQLLHALSKGTLNGDVSAFTALDLERADLSLDSLLDCLGSLLNTLEKRQAIFLLIDSVTWFETIEKQCDMHKALHGILSLMEHPSVVLKIWLTDCWDYEVPAQFARRWVQMTVPNWVDGYRGEINPHVVMEASQSIISNFDPFDSTSEDDDDSEGDMW